VWVIPTAILKVARTIADLDDTERIGSDHLSEAIGWNAGSVARRQSRVCSSGWASRFARFARP
jgi:hypothetical protein